MRSNRKWMMLMVALVAVTSAETCITVRDDSVVAVNVDDVTGTYSVTAGTLLFTNPNRCVTKNPADYLSGDYATITAARVVDVRIMTTGAFTGSINGGSVTINNVQLASYSGPWSSFANEQSILTSPLITRNQAGISALVAAFQAKQPVTVCVDGTFSSAAPAGLAVVVKVYGQVDATLGS